MSFQVERHTSELGRAPRASRACQLCHDQKVRCDVSSTKPQCTNCQRRGQRCKTRIRQRRSKRTSEPPTSDSASLGYALVGVGPEPPEVAPNADPVRRPYGTRNTRSGASGPQVEPETSAVCEVRNATNSSESVFMGRSSYIAPDDYRAEDGIEVPYNTQALSEINKKILNLQGALDLPPRIVSDSLFQNFWSYCHPWDPVIDKSLVMRSPIERLSPLLLQAIFLAGSRMSCASASNVATSQSFYNRAKTLFYLNLEQDPLTLLTAVSLLHWWNPHGPERISTDTSTFWCRITIGLAQQIGLHRQRMHIPDGPRRRRLWWSLVARDCLISLAHGRPQTINPDDCDVPRLTLDDFPNPDIPALVFIAYIDLSQILGRFTANGLRRAPSRLHNADFEDSLYRWIKTLPESVCPWKQLQDGTSNQSLMPCTFESRQLYILYLVSLVLLYRPKTMDGPFPAVAVIASSLIASAFEEFPVRDEVRLLGPVFTFHLLVAAIALLSCYKYSGFWTVAEEDLKIIQHAQQELLKKWPSALGSIRSFERMQKLATTTLRSVVYTPQVRLTKEQVTFFEDVDTTVCRMWGIVQKANSTGNYGMLRGNEREMLRQSATISFPTTNISFPHQSAIEPLHNETLYEQNNLGADTYNDNSQDNNSIGDWLFWDQLHSDFEP